jgi:hypothetical protein
MLPLATGSGRPGNRSILASDPEGPAPRLPEDFAVPFGRWVYYGPIGEIVDEEHYGP